MRLCRMYSGLCGERAKFTLVESLSSLVHTVPAFIARFLSHQNSMGLQTWSGFAAAAATKSRQPCPTLCDPIDSSPTGSPVPGNSPGKNTAVGCHFLLQCMKVKSESEVAQSCPTLRDPRTAAYQAPPSMGFSRQEYWSRVPLPSPEVGLFPPYYCLQ